MIVVLAAIAILFAAAAFWSVDRDYGEWKAANRDLSYGFRPEEERLP